MSDPEISQSSNSVEKATLNGLKAFKKEVDAVIEKGDRLYPKQCANWLCRHTANIIQRGNPDKVCTIWRLLLRIQKIIVANWFFP